MAKFKDSIDILRSVYDCLVSEYATDHGVGEGTACACGLEGKEGDITGQSKESEYGCICVDRSEEERSEMRCSLWCVQIGAMRGLSQVQIRGVSQTSTEYASPLGEFLDFLLGKTQNLVDVFKSIWITANGEIHE